MRLIDADKIVYSWQVDADGQIHDGITLQSIIKKMPTIEERKTGRWIEVPNHNAYKCSECERLIETTDGKNNVCKHYPYCHCGAKMEVEHDI